MNDKTALRIGYGVMALIVAPIWVAGVLVFGKTFFQTMAWGYLFTRLVPSADWSQTGFALLVIFTVMAYFRMTADLLSKYNAAKTKDH